MVKKGGSVWKDKNTGLWRAAVTMDGHRRSSPGFPLKREAEAWRRERLAEIERGLTYTAEKTTLSVFAEDWLTMKAAAGLAPNSIAAYRLSIDKHILPNLGRYKLGEITPARVQAYVNRLTKSGAGKPTARAALGVLNGILNHAVGLRVLGYNPAAAVQSPNERREPMQPWSDAEASRFMASIRGHRNEHLYACALATGARRSELVALRWSDLDWSGALRISQQLYRPRGGGWQFAPTKSERGVRMLELDAAMLDRLRDQSERVHKMRLSAENKWQEHDFIFPTTVGSPISAIWLETEFLRLQEQAGVRQITLHGLRHTNISYLLMHGVPAPVVAQRVGDNLTTVLKTYAHFIPGLSSNADQVAGSLVTLVEWEGKRAEK